jgi:cyclopropane fatty-acyl-phospholipid synthase-like methyltransferase
VESQTTLSPDRILEIGESFRSSKTLLSAVELGVFTILAADGPLGEEALSQRVGVHPRGARDFLDALVALHLLERGADHKYANTLEADRFLDRRKPTYSGGFLELCNARLYPAWAELTAVLQTGRSVNDDEAYPDGHYSRLYSEPSDRETFLGAMTAGARPVAQAIAATFPWRDHHTVLDIGCAEGCLLVEVAKAHPHINGCGFDLPAVRPSFERYVQLSGVASSLAFQAGDFRVDVLPRADVIVLGRVLHNWDLDTKKQILAKVWAALPESGTLLVYERLIDDERRSSAAALLASLNMLVVTSGGFDFTSADCIRWMREAGFRDARVEPLVASHSMVVATR